MTDPFGHGLLSLQGAPCHAMPYHTTTLLSSLSFSSLFLSLSHVFFPFKLAREMVLNAIIPTGMEPKYQTVIKKAFQEMRVLKKEKEAKLETRL